MWLPAEARASGFTTPPLYIRDLHFQVSPNAPWGRARIQAARKVVWTSRYTRPPGRKKLLDTPPPVTSRYGPFGRSSVNTISTVLVSHVYAMLLREGVQKLKQIMWF